MKTGWLALLVLVSAPAWAAPQPPLPFMSASDFTPYWNDSAQKPAPLPATVTPFQLKTQSNGLLTEASLRGHVSLVNFFFTSCGSLCPRLMSQVQKVQEKLAPLAQARFYSFSVTPERDSPERLLDYAKARKLDLRNWDLVTGDHDAIFGLGRGVFRADRNPDGTRSKSLFIHTTAIYLVDSNLRVRGVYLSDKPADMQLLVQDAQRLAQE